MKLSLWQKMVRQVGVKNCESCAIEYRFYSRFDKHYQTFILGHDYHDANISLYTDGYVVVREGAGSDGCTPVWLFFNLSYWGVPNGRVLPETKEHITAPAYYLHDHLLRIRHQLGIPAYKIHIEFCREITKSAFWAAKLYCKTVKRFGPKD